MAVMEDITGRRFGKLTVVSFSFRRKSHYYWRVTCDCGHKTQASRSSLISGQTTKCRSCGYESLKLSLVGRKYGFWIVIGYAGTNKNQNTVWRCKCICGVEKNVVGIELNRNKSKSCGCKRNYLIRKTSRKPIKDVLMSKAYASHLGLAKRRGIISYLTLNDYKIIATKPCLYCGSISKRRDRVRSKYRRSYKINSVDRLDNERFYKIENSVSACFDCQEMKMDRTFLEFKNHILKIHDKLFRPDNGNHPV